MQRVWAIMHKEFLHIFRDIRTLSLIIFLPVLMLLLLGYAVSSDIENIPLAVVDLSRTDQSRQFIDRYWLSGIFHLTYQVESETEILELIDRGEVQAGLLIPENFADNTASGQGTEILFFLDASDPTLGQVMQLAAETIGQDASAEIQIQALQRRMGGRLEETPAIETHLRFLYNPDMRRLNYLIPALAAAILQAQTLLLTGFSIVREREQGTLEQLIVSPIQPWELMLGKILPFVLIGFINLWITLALGSIWFQVPIQGSLIVLALLSLLFMLGSLGLGMLISIIARTQIQAMHIAMFINLPSLILSGFIFPRYNMPWIAYYAGYLLPLTYFTDIIRGIALKGIDFHYLTGAIWPLALFSVLVFSASVLLFRKRIE